MSDPIRFENYELLRNPDGSPLELGRGAMGVTYKARDTDLHCDVALKVINPGILSSPEVRDRFLREARAAARLRHPNIATVFRLGVTPDGTHYYAMEFCDGQTLQQALAGWGSLPAMSAVHLAWQVCKALRLAEEQRLIHRDLKPANLILVETPDEGLVVKVIDFGLAKSFADGHQTFSTSGAGFAGTAHFASPEQIDESALDIRSDIYSLGVCLWFMLTGHPPFEGSAARVMSQTLSAELPWVKLAGQPAPVIALLRRMLAKNRDDRPPTAAALRAEMERCMQALDVPPAPPETAATHAATERRMGAAEALADEDKPTIKAANAGTDAERLAARFQLGERLGRDALGRVFRAADRENGGTAVTYRVIEPALTAVPITRRELDAQLTAARAHPHPNLVNVLASAVTAQGHIVVTEKIAGFTLLELLKHRGALPPHEAMLLLAPLAAAADHATTHGLHGFSLGKGQTWVHLAAATSAEDRQQTLTKPIGTWPPHELKVEALSLGGSGGGDDDALQSMVTLATAGHGFGTTRRTAPAALAHLASELLGGSAGRTFTPIPRLTEAANAILRRASTDPAAYPTATAFLTALRPALGKAPTPPFTKPPSTATPPVPAPIPPPVAPHSSARPFARLAAIAAFLAILGLAYYYGIRAPRERAREDRRSQVEDRTRELTEKPSLAQAENERLKIAAEKAQAEAAKAQAQMEETKLALAREATASKAATPAPPAAVTPPMNPASSPATPSPAPAPLTARELRTLSGHTSDICTVIFSPDGRRVASGNESGECLLWDAESGKLLRTISTRKDDLQFVSFSPDGRRLFAGGYSGSISLWDIELGKELRTTGSHNQVVNAVAFSPDGRRVAAGGSRGDAGIFDAERLDSLQRLSGHSEGVSSIAFSPDSRWVATGSRDNTARLWDATSGVAIRTFSGHAHHVLAVAFSPDGRRVATGSGDRTARIWDATNGKVLLTLTGHFDSVLSVAFSPDGRLLATGSSDNSVRLWDAVSGRELLVFQGHTNDVVVVAFSPDGRLLLTGSRDRTAKLWELSGEQHAPRTFKDAELSKDKDDTSSAPKMASLPGERHPETRTRLLKIEDIQTLTDDNLRYAINEMFARRGAEFRDKDLKKLFAKYPWYRPIAGKTYEMAEAEFTPIETQNLKLLGALRDRREGRPVQVAASPPETLRKEGDLTVATSAPRPEKSWDKPHIFLHIAKESQRRAALELKGNLAKAGCVIVGVQNVAGNDDIPAQSSELRYFTPYDAVEAKKLAGLMSSFFGPAGIIPDLPPGLPTVTHARQYEIWFSNEFHEPNNRPSESVAPAVPNPSVPPMRSGNDPFAGSWSGRLVAVAAQYPTTGGPPVDVVIRLSPKTNTATVGFVPGTPQQMALRLQGNEIQLSKSERTVNHNVTLTLRPDGRTLDTRYRMSTPDGGWLERGGVLTKSK